MKIISFLSNSIKYLNQFNLKYLIIVNSIFIATLLWGVKTGIFFFMSLYYSFIIIFLINYIILKLARNNRNPTFVAAHSISTITIFNYLILFYIVLIFIYNCYLFSLILTTENNNYFFLVQQGSNFFKIHSALAIWFIILITVAYIGVLISVISNISNISKAIEKSEIYLIMPLCYLSLIFLITCTNLFIICTITEILSICFISLINWRVDEKVKKYNLSVSIKYYILSLIFTIIGYSGCVMILFSCGSVDLVLLSKHIIFSESSIARMGVVCIFIWLLFKIGLFPFASYVNEICIALSYPVLNFYLNVIKPCFFSLFLIINIFLFNNVIWYPGLVSVIEFITSMSIIISIAGAWYSRDMKLFFSYTSLFNYSLAVMILSASSSITIALSVSLISVYTLAGAAVIVYIGSFKYGLDQNEGMVFLNELVYLRHIAFNNWDKIESKSGGNYNFNNFFNSSGLTKYQVFKKIIYICSFSVVVLVLTGFPPMVMFLLKLWTLYYFFSQTQFWIIVFLVLAYAGSYAYYFKIFTYMFNGVAETHKYANTNFLRYTVNNTVLINMYLLFVSCSLIILSIKLYSFDCIITLNTISTIFIT